MARLARFLRGLREQPDTWDAGQVLRLLRSVPCDQSVGLLSGLAVRQRARPQDPLHPAMLNGGAARPITLCTRGAVLDREVSGASASTTPGVVRTPPGPAGRR